MFSTINRLKALVAAGILAAALGAAAAVPLVSAHDAVAPTAGALLAKHGADDPAGHAKHGADDPAGHHRHGADDPAGHA